MIRLSAAASVLALTAGMAAAGGIDRSGQGIGILFEKGRVVELSLGRVSPDVSGEDLPLGPFPGGGDSGDVAAGYNQTALSFKMDFNEKLSGALIVDQPFGADVLYGAGSVNLGGTFARAEATSVTGILRYKITPNFSVHGGLRANRASGEIGLRGAAYGGFNGYTVELAGDTAYGYLVGVAYEKPEIALRVALTYNSELNHTFDTVETVALGAVVVGIAPTDVTLPQSVNLDFQSGIAKDTLVFGQIRWVDWEAFKVDPAFFTPRAGGGLIDLENTVTYSLGVGRRFNETWSGSFSMQYEPSTDPLVSPLAPTDGRFGVTLAAVYAKDNFKITTGVNYTWLGDAEPETGTPDVARADFTDNTSVGVGVRIAYTF